MRTIVGENNYSFSQNVVQLLFSNNEFELQLKDTLDILKQIHEILYRDDHTENYTIADAVEQWLRFHITTDNIEHKLLIEQQVSKILNPVSLVANFLHPSYQGRRFMNTKRYAEIVNEFLIDELDENGLTDLVKYSNKNGLFHKLFSKEIKSPTTFWNFAKTEHPNLARFSLKLLIIPALTKRIAIPVNKNNNSNLETQQKLIEVFHYLKINDTK